MVVQMVTPGADPWTFDCTDFGYDFANLDFDFDVTLLDELCEVNTDLDLSPDLLRELQSDLDAVLSSVPTDLLRTGFPCLNIRMSERPILGLIL